jgi:hypothetical protein
MNLVCIRIYPSKITFSNASSLSTMYYDRTINNLDSIIVNFPTYPYKEFTVYENGDNIYYTYKSKQEIVNIALNIVSNFKQELDKNRLNEVILNLMIDIVNLKMKRIDIRFDYINNYIQKHYNNYNINKINNDINEIKEIINECINKSIYRGEKLDVLHDKSSNLVHLSNSFKKDSKKLNRCC